MTVDYLIQVSEDLARHILQANEYSAVPTKIDILSESVMQCILNYVKYEGKVEDLDDGKLYELSLETYLSSFMTKEENDSEHVLEPYGDYLHVIPIEDKVHLPSPECWCQPRVCGKNQGTLVVHLGEEE